MTVNSTTTLDDPMQQTATGPGHGPETNPLPTAGQEAGERAAHLAERAADVGFQQADRGREQAANGIDKVVQSIRRVSTDMQAEQPAIANAALTAADQGERIAQYLRRTDARRMVSSVEEIARRQPLIFLGGAFLIGVAASRFIKAAGGTSTGRTGQLGYRSSYGAGNRFAEGSLTNEGL